MKPCPMCHDPRPLSLGDMICCPKCNTTIGPPEAWDVLSDATDPARCEPVTAIDAADSAADL